MLPTLAWPNRAERNDEKKISQLEFLEACKYFEFWKIDMPLTRHIIPEHGSIWPQGFVQLMSYTLFRPFELLISITTLGANVVKVSNLVENLSDS